MFKKQHFAVLAVVPLLLTALPAAAADSDFLSVIGDFITDGLAPARTMEDIQREEREAWQRKLQAERAAENADEKDADEDPAKAAAVVEPAPQPALPAKSAPVKTASLNTAPVETPKLERKEEVLIPPPPPPRPVMQAKALPDVKLPPPEPLKSRVAATARLDQAGALGGSARSRLGAPQPISGK